MKKKNKTTKQNFIKKEEIVDVTGIVLTPGYNGEKCLGNGKHKTRSGKIIVCCCDECDYLLLCYPDDAN